jgi:hypothetical protein
LFLRAGFGKVAVDASPVKLYKSANEEACNDSGARSWNEMIMQVVFLGGTVIKSAALA